MKVLLISVRSDVGGGPKHLYDLISSKPYKELEIHIASPNDEPFGNLFKESSNDFIQIPHRKFSVFKFFKLLNHCRQNSINIIHSHGRGAGIYSRLLSLFGFPVVHTFHGVHREKTIIGLIKSFTDVFLSPLATKYICVSADEKREAIKSHYCREAEVVYNGTEIPSTPRTDFKSALEIKVGTLSRLTHQKGVDILLEMAKVCKNLSCKFHIAGDGELETDLKKQLNQLNLSNVEFLGRTNNPKKFLNEIDIYVSTSRWEGFPLSVIEAMATPVPCLLSDVPGHGYFKKYSLASMYDLNNSDQFKRELSSLIDSEDQRTKMANKSRDVIVKYLSIDKMSSRTIEVYRASI